MLHYDKIENSIQLIKNNHQKYILKIILRIIKKMNMDIVFDTDKEETYDSLYTIQMYINKLPDLINTTNLYPFYINIKTNYNKYQSCEKYLKIIQLSKSILILKLPVCLVNIIVEEFDINEY